jgi:hypothetical protein
MFSTLWQKWFNRRPQPCRRRTTQRRCQPCLEVLEDRLAPAVLTVNTTSDGNDPTVLSLRQAIQAVDSQSLAVLSPQQQQQVSGNLGDNDQIVFAPGLSGTIQLTQGELDLTQSVMIAGPGAANLSIDAQGLSRIFAVLNPDINVTLDGLKITGGMASDMNGALGGGIFNEGNLTVSNCILSHNSVQSFGDGGGIENDFGNLTVSNCTLADNSAMGQGGGIFNNGGNLVVNNSTLSGNSASISGGGIDNLNGRGTLMVCNSTLFGNSAGFEGGAIENWGTATLTSVTVTGNVTGDEGGAINTVSESGSLGTMRLDNTIVAGNFLGMTCGPASDIVGTLDPNSSYNLIGTGGSGGLFSGVNNNLVGVSDPGLEPLADNGGPTQTCALLSSSPASGAGDPTLEGSTDQRGIVRTGFVSIGAYQDSPPPGSQPGPFLGYPSWNPWNPDNPGPPRVGRMM